MTSLAVSQAREGGPEPWACTQGGTSIAARARDGLQAAAVRTLTRGSRRWDAGTHVVRLRPVGPVALRPYCVQLQVPRAYSREARPRGARTQALPVFFSLASGDSMPSGFLSTAWAAGPLCSFSPGVSQGSSLVPWLFRHLTSTPSIFPLKTHSGFCCSGP